MFHSRSSSYLRRRRLAALHGLARSLAAALSWPVAALLLVVLALPAGLRAQGPMDAALRGRAVLPRGLPAALDLQLVTGSGVEVNRFRAARDGSFFLLRLAPGSYTLRSAAPGLEGALALTLGPGELQDITLLLRPAASAAASPKTTASQRAGASFGDISGEDEDLAERDTPGQELTRLPVPQREVAALAQTEPLLHEAISTSPGDSGAVDPETAEERSGDDRNTADSAEAAAGVSSAGLALTLNDATADGLSASQYFRGVPRGSAAGGTASRSAFAQGAVRSLRIAPSDFSPEGSGGGGVLTSLSSRRGVESLHGSGFVLLREGAWAAANPFSVVTHYTSGSVSSSLARPGGEIVQVGGSAGGPLPALGRSSKRARAPRLWLFGAVEAQLAHDQITSTPAVASFYQLTPTQTALLGTRGVSSLETQEALSFLDSLTGTINRSSQRLNGFARFDAAPTQRDTVAVTYAAHRLSAPAGVALGQASDAVVALGLGSLGDRFLRVDAGAAHWLHRFSQSLDNELSLQAAQELDRDQPRPPLAQEPAIGPGGYAPEISIAPNGFAYGTPSSLGRAAYPEETRVEAHDALSWRLRAHLLRIGGEWSRIDDALDAISNADGTFHYNSGVSAGHAGGLVDWITDFTFNVHAYPNGGCPSVFASAHFFCFHTFAQSFGPQQLSFAVHQFAGFAQDSVRLREDLVLNVGARYDYTLLPVPIAPNYALDTAIATLYRSDAGVTESLPEDRNNLGPRVSLAWMPRFGPRRAPAFTLHLGYGVFYGRTPGATLAAALTDTALPSSTERVRIRPTTITQCPQVTAGSQGFGYPCDYTAAPPAAVAQTTSALVFSSRFREPAIQRGTLALERELGRHGWLRAGYAMATATQLPASVDLNIASSLGTSTFVLEGGDGRIGVRNGETFVLPVYGSRPIAQYGVLTALESHANATFHAGTMEAGLRGWHGLSAHGGVTFSRTIDYGPQQGATPRQSSQLDPFINGYDKGLSSLQLPIHVAAAVQYRAATERGEPEQGTALRRALLGGWTAGLLAVAGSGPPYSYATFGGTYLSGGSDSLNGSGGAVYLPTVGRNTLRLPARSRLDLRLSRGWSFGSLRSRWRAEVFAQAFNLANSVSLSRVETRAFLVGTPATAGAPTLLLYQDAATVASEGILTPAFGTPLSSTTGLSRERQVELGLRVQF